ncbi:FmdB family transcriptional regulator [candidate division KSB3 bacterium]|uniref:FmdB family transcriptional regulator n=1 Tax=candidate division KSB3 bacterium TaxID=2044937 RepID=A0A2G6E906_9BACT|nr:MAG: FmdB family transcriptional regulator [candidate division KSB3 bacterium]PIE29517.1 MAG: FmdB family transcriptional regulator [candidate division KSB3 bacterium]
MPIYEYHCTECGCDFEKLVFKRSEPVACPSCQAWEVQKKFSTFGMKSGEKVVSSSASSCGSCSSHSCATCQH